MACVPGFGESVCLGNYPVAPPNPAAPQGMGGALRRRECKPARQPVSQPARLLAIHGLTTHARKVFSLDSDAHIPNRCRQVAPVMYVCGHWVLSGSQRIRRRPHQEPWGRIRDPSYGSQVTACWSTLDHHWGKLHASLEHPATRTHGLSREGGRREEDSLQHRLWRCRGAMPTRNPRCPP